MVRVKESETKEPHGLKYFKVLYNENSENGLIFRVFLKEQQYKIVFNRNSRMKMPLAEYKKFIDEIV